MSRRGGGRGSAAALAALAACALAFPAHAPAADARTDIRVGQSAGSVAEDAPPAKEAESTASSLPFTGTDAIALGALTLSLLAAGFALRHFSTR